MFRMIVAGVLVAHGLIHVLGIAAYTQIAELSQLPYKTTLFEGRWEVGDVGMRLFGVLWGVPAIGFAAAAAALIMGSPSWVPILLSTTVASLALTVLDWEKAFVGAVLNMAILAALWLLWWFDADF